MCTHSKTFLLLAFLPTRGNRPAPFLSAFLPLASPVADILRGILLGLACEKSAVSLDWTGFSLPPLPFPQRPALPTGSVGGLAWARQGVW